MEKKVLLGNEAIARGAYEAGCHVATAYPGTPSTEILESIARDFPDIQSQWSPNEKVAMEVAAGVSIAGARVLCAMKHVGLNVAADPLFTFSYTGVNAGFVIINADDPGAWSSQNEQDNRHYARAAKVPMIEPSSPEEAREFTKRAFAISEQFDRPVIVRITTRIAHSQGVVFLQEKEDIPVKDFEWNPQKYVMIPAHARPRHAIIEQKMQEMAIYSNSTDLNRVEMGDTKRGIITNSVAYQYVKETCPNDSILKIGMIWPMPDQLIRDFASQVDELYVVEELDPFIEDYVKAMGIPIIGKEIIPLLGELTPDIVDKAMNQKEQIKSTPDYDQEIPARPPMLCKGCPHIFSFEILRDLGYFVHGDIGCYTLGVLPPYTAMHAQGCMGASIGLHLGFEKAHGDAIARKSVAVIGDSTFLHSGIPALIDMVYNKNTGTIIILDNRITAMTGQQDHPASGRTLMGEDTHEVDLEAICRAVGVKRVTTIDPKNNDQLKKLIEQEVAAREPSVIITKRKCILSK